MGFIFHAGIVEDEIAGIADALGEAHHGENVFKLGDAAVGHLQLGCVGIGFIGDDEADKTAKKDRDHQQDCHQRGRYAAGTAAATGLGGRLFLIIGFGS